jgi:hypothetical protein
MERTPHLTVMNQPATFPSTRSPRTGSIDFLLETVLRSLDATQAKLAVNGIEPSQCAQPVPDSGVEYNFRYLHAFLK